MRAAVVAALACLWAAAPARAQDLMALLKKGPLVLVQNDAHGKFDRATAIIDVKAPPDAVWDVVTNFSNYRYFMPKVVKSEVHVDGPNQEDVAYEIDVPISNESYVFHYVLDPQKRTAHGQWLKGDIEGSFCDWRIVPVQGGTLIYYTTASRNYSSLAQKLEDSQQTITVGINVAAALATVRAIKHRTEGLSSVANP